MTTNKHFVYRTSSVEWKPSPVVALATSVDGSQVAATREDGSLEIWLVSAGSVGWHCQLTIHGNSNSRVSSLVWCRSGSTRSPLGRLLSSSIDGSVSEWDLFNLRQKIVLESIGVSIWQIAAEPCNDPKFSPNKNTEYEIGHANVAFNGTTGDESSVTSSDESSESEEDDDNVSVELHEEHDTENSRIAFACDDGCVRIYTASESDKLTYYRSLQRVSGRTLSVTWSTDASKLYSGSSDGFIRCWDVKLCHELYRITVGLGGLGTGNELCIWSLLALRCGTVVSGDSNGTVQFWDSKHGTLLQAHSCHKGDVNALAASPSHTRVFSAGADGQVILYKVSTEAVEPADVNLSSEVIKKWVYIGYVRAHTHDVRALTIAVPISSEGEDGLGDERVKKPRGKEKPLDFSYHKWARLGVPMLLSAGDDTKLFAYSAKEFTKYSPHDICPAPQRVPVQLVQSTIFNQTALLLVQASTYLDIFSVSVKAGGASVTGTGHSGEMAATANVAKVCNGSKIICSAMCPSGTLVALSDHVKPKLFDLKKNYVICRRKLPLKLPFAHSMSFSSDSSRWMIAGHDRRIYVVDLGSLKLVHVFTPYRKELDEESSPSEPPITKMFTSPDGQWLAAINCFGDVYIFNLELSRQHWFISRLDGASITAGGFTPRNSNVLILSTSSNQVYAFDVEAKQLGEWSIRNTFSLPKRYQEFPGEVVGVSFPPSSTSSSLIVYSSRAMCLIDFEMPVVDDEFKMSNCQDLASKLQKKLKRKLRGNELESKQLGRKNFEFCAFRDPVLFVGHLSKNSILIIEKPWVQVVNSFDAPPVHRHIYGT